MNECTFEIKAIYNTGFAIVVIRGKDLGDAFYKFYKKEIKAMRQVIGFEIWKDNK